MRCGAANTHASKGTGCLRHHQQTITMIVRPFKRESADERLPLHCVWSHRRKDSNGACDGLEIWGGSNNKQTTLADAPGRTRGCQSDAPFPSVPSVPLFGPFCTAFCQSDPAFVSVCCVASRFNGAPGTGTGTIRCLHSLLRDFWML